MTGAKHHSPVDILCRSRSLHTIQTLLRAYVLVLMRPIVGELDELWGDHAKGTSWPICI